MFKKIFRMEEKATVEALSGAGESTTATKLSNLSEVDKHKLRETADRPVHQLFQD